MAAIRPRSILCLAPFLLLLPVACGAVIVEPDGGSGGSSSTTTTTTGSGGSPSCVETHDALSVRLDTALGKFIGCGEGSDEVLWLDAKVLESGPDFFTYDGCFPNIACDPQVGKLTVTAPGLSIASIPPGTFVHIRIEVLTGNKGECTQEIQVNNLPNWEGVPNPVVPGEWLWLQALDGANYVADGVVYAQLFPLGCPIEDLPNECGERYDYTWHFSPTPDKEPIVVAMGETRSWVLQNGAVQQQVLARNLRAFTTGVCTDAPDLAYWVVNDDGLH